MSTKYDRDYFIRKFEAIPDELWMTESYTDGTRCCAYGHCGRRSAKHPCDDDPHTPESRALSVLFEAAGITFLRVAPINDGYCLEYQQHTPKARILAALRDLPDPTP